MSQVSGVNASPSMSAASPSESSVTVERGDTLSAIAREHGVSVGELMAANPQIRNADVIYPGQQLHIPGGTPAPSTPVEGQVGAGGAFDYDRIAGVAGNPNVTPAFIQEVEAMAGRLGTRPEFIMATMSFETGGTFSPSVKNPTSSATGLIQFLDGTARGLGTSTAELSRMSPVEQLGYVENYFEPFAGRLGTLEAVYTAVLSGSPKPDPNTTLFSSGSNAYSSNRGLDLNGDGRITAGEATSKVRDRISASISDSPAPAAAGNGTGTSGSKPAGGDYTVERGDTLSAIAQQHGVSLSALIASNPQISNPNLIHPGQQVHLPGGSAASGGSHAVQRGDSLSAIAQQYGVSLASLISANPQVSNPNLIYPGQTIAIPGVPRGGGTAPVEGPSGPSAPVDGSNPASIARQYLERNASELKRSGDLPMNPNVPSDVCCANFVSAVLERAGLITHGQRSDSVSTLRDNLVNAGWDAVPLSQARPGDVVIIKGGGISHTEIVASNDNGKVTFIGSNNRNADGTQRVTTDSGTWFTSTSHFTILTPPR